MRQFADETGYKLGKVAQPLRAALTGRSTSPGIFDVLAVLGREESLARIGDQVHAGKLLNCLTFKHVRLLHCGKIGANICGSATSEFAKSQLLAN